MITNKINALVQYRLEQADESIKAALLLFNEGILRRSVNNSYYAMFYAVMALLAINKKETSKHGGAIGLFDREFVKTDIFSKDFSRWLHRAFDLRQRCDYEAEFSVSPEDAQMSLRSAQKFLSEVKSVITEIIARDEIKE